MATPLPAPLPAHMTFPWTTYVWRMRHTAVMATVGDRFQVVIERDVRRELLVKPGDRAVETVENGRLVITFLPALHRRSLRGRLKGEGRVRDMSALRDGPTIADLVATEHPPES